MRTTTTAATTTATAAAATRVVSSGVLGLADHEAEEVALVEQDEDESHQDDGDQDRHARHDLDEEGCVET